MGSNDSGIHFIEPGSDMQLVNAVKQILLKRKEVQEMGKQARITYEKYFDNDTLKVALEKPLKMVGL